MPISDPGGAPAYALATVFLEFGTLHEPSVQLVPIQFAKTDTKAAATGATVLEKRVDGDDSGGRSSESEHDTTQVKFVAQRESELLKTFWLM